MDKLTLLSMMESSGMAYTKKFPQCENCETKDYNIKENGVQFVICKSCNTIRIVFRGTDSFKDTLTDLHLWRKTIPYNNNNSKIRVHSGFINAYKNRAVRDKIHSYINEDITKIEVTGHSYGAALACLCSIDLQYNFPRKDIEVALFGCPRVGNRAFRKSYNKRLFKVVRVENGNDSITKVPFAFMGYRHIGSRINIGAPRILGISSILQHRQQAYYGKLLKLL